VRLRRLDGTVSPYLYIAPFFIVFLGFGLFPLLYTFYVSLTNWDLTNPAHTYVGLRNYGQLLADPYFWNALRNTGSIWVLSTVAVIFAQLFGRDFGLVNRVLHFVGLGPVDWQVGRLTGQSAISLMVIWRWTGYNALLYLAALQAVPRELYEAASIDGASSLQQFRRITIPMLRPTIIFTVIVATIGGMQLFAEPLLFDSSPASVTGGASREFQTVTLYLYEQGFRNLKFGYASAIAWALFVVIVIASGVNYALTRRIRSTDR